MTKVQILEAAETTKEVVKLLSQHSANICVETVFRDVLGAINGDPSRASTATAVSGGK